MLTETGMPMPELEALSGADAVTPDWAKLVMDLGHEEGVIRLVDGGALSWTYGVFPQSNWDLVKHGYRDAVICLDSRSSWRKQQYATYKERRANRRSDDPKVAAKKAMVDHFREALAIDPTLRRCILEGFEADDLVAIHYLHARAAGHPVQVYAVDKDLVQVPGLIHCMYGFDGERRTKSFEDSLRRIPLFWPGCRNERDVLLGQALFGDRSDSIERLLAPRDRATALAIYNAPWPFAKAYEIFGDRLLDSLYQLLIPSPALHIRREEFRQVPTRLLHLVDTGTYWDHLGFPHTCSEPDAEGW